MKNINETKLTQFMLTYEKYLIEQMKLFPKDYLPGLTAGIITERMTAALKKRSANIDSRSFRRTFKELNIKPTYKALYEYLES